MRFSGVPELLADTVSLTVSGDETFWPVAASSTNTLSLTAGIPAALWVIQICVSGGTPIFYATMRAPTGNEVNFNSGAGLVASAGYLFDLLVTPADRIWFSLSAACTVQVFRIVQLRALT